MGLSTVWSPLPFRSTSHISYLRNHTNRTTTDIREDGTVPPFRNSLHSDSAAGSTQNDDQTDNSARDEATTSPSRAPFWSAVVLTGVITVASFVLSFAALWDLFTQVGQPRELSWLFAILLDGAILQATISVVWLADAPGEKGRSDRRFFWIVLIFSATASIFGNALHAYTNHAPGFNPWLAAVIATIAPVALLFSSHGLTILARRSRPHPTPSLIASKNETAIPLPAIPEANEEEVTGDPSTDPSKEDFNAPEELSESEIKKFASNEDRKEYALALNASGSSMTDIAAAVDRSPSTIYRWIDEAKESRPLVPQGRQLTNVG